MRIFRDLSIAGKLALASCSTLVLLAILVWSLMSAMADQRALDSALAAAQGAERTVQAAVLSQFSFTFLLHFSVLTYIPALAVLILHFSFTLALNKQLNVAAR